MFRYVSGSLCTTTKIHVNKNNKGCILVNLYSLLDSERVPKCYDHFSCFSSCCCSSRYYKILNSLNPCQSTPIVTKLRTDNCYHIPHQVTISVFKVNS